jgi:hypothetical protein
MNTWELLSKNVCKANRHQETYEPLFNDLLDAENGFKIRSIWIADVANQGASYALNEADLGDDPNWLDHSRDLLLMVDTFRDRMKAPFVGLGHSFGGFQMLVDGDAMCSMAERLTCTTESISPSFTPVCSTQLFSSIRSSRTSHHQVPTPV